ncbi:hypothetical protein FRAHR75_1500013 [Frankia sp. Hr75.2]|nr:hypothetical protein FRAHR75_1500013 [Frankia sp. Hr75.2]
MINSLAAGYSEHLATKIDYQTTHRVRKNNHLYIVVQGARSPLSFPLVATVSHSDDYTCKTKSAYSKCCVCW